MFVEEQGVPPEQEWDGGDASAFHLLAECEDGRQIGTGRLHLALSPIDVPQGHLGRIAVLPSWRRRGVGSALVEAALHLAAAHGARVAHLNAQIHAIAFYKRLGFHPIGAVFTDAGILHRRMDCTSRMRVERLWVKISR